MATIESIRSRISSTSSTATPPDEKVILLAALNDHEKMEALRTQVSALPAFNWTSVLTAILSLIPGLAPFMTIINAILALLNIPPIPNPPTNGGGTFPPVPPVPVP